MARLNLPMIISSQASFPMEEIAKANGDGPRFYQLYWGKADAVAESFVKRAEAVGCRAIFITLDTLVLGWRPRDLDLGFYLFRGGMRPHGLGREHDERLNAALFATLQPIGEASEALGADHLTSRLAIADVFAHASGLLLLAHTRRIRIFTASARELMERHVDRLIVELEKGEPYAND